MKCAPNACDTCPYRRATPPGVWDPSEYLKLARYDWDPSLAAKFLCHSDPDRESLCTGWLAVHGGGIVATRILMLSGKIKVEDMPKHDPAVYYESGEEAALAGLRAICKPSRIAKQTIAKIDRQRRRQKGRSR